MDTRLCEQPGRPRSGGIHDHPCSDIERAARQDIPGCDPGQSAAELERAKRLSVIGQSCTVRGRGKRESQRQAIAVNGLVVVPHGPASTAGEERITFRAKQRASFVGGDDAARRQLMRGCEAVVAIATDEGINRKRGSHHQRMVREAVRRREHKRQRPHKSRSDARRSPVCRYRRPP